jgi:recombination protein RecA
MATEKKPSLSEEKQKLLQATLQKLEKEYGKGTVMRLDERADQTIEVIPTGSLALDAALGVGGLPRGRIVEVYGPEASGKTTLALHAIAEANKLGGMAAFVDAEHAFDPVYAQKLGIDTTQLIISQPDYGEQALEIADTLIRSGALDVVVIDSVAALVPKAELEGEMGDAKVGLQARLMSQALRKLTASISRTRCIAIFINQLREKIGGMAMYGPSETTTGGNALKFYASVRLDVRRIGAIKEGNDIIGHRVRVKVVKNKVAPPFKTAEFDILYGEGISRIGEVIDIGVQLGIIQKSGSWYSYEGQRLAQGRENLRAFLKDHPELVEKLEKQIRPLLMQVTDVLLASTPLDDIGAAESTE